MLKHSNVIIFFIAFLIATSTAYCSIINGPANVKSSPNGEMLLTLNDNVYAQISHHEDEYVMINLKCWVSLDRLKDIVLEKGALLEDIDGEIIGNVLNDTPILRMHFLSGDKVCISIRGYVDESNIKDINSYPKLIQPVDTLKLNNCIKYYLENEYQMWSELGGNFSEHRLMGLKIEDDIIDAYLWTYIMEYYSVSYNIRKGSGISAPLKLMLIQYKNSYKVIGFERASSGEGYGESIRKIFPKQYQDKIFNFVEYFDPKELDLGTMKQAENYYNKTYKSSKNKK